MDIVDPWVKDTVRHTVVLHFTTDLENTERVCIFNGIVKKRAWYECPVLILLLLTCNGSAHHLIKNIHTDRV